VPPPTSTGTRNSWYSSTSPASIACAASAAPPTLKSAPALAFSRRIASGSNSRSIIVRALVGVCSVLE
jgi:hypothetical protein